MKKRSLKKQLPKKQLQKFESERIPDEQTIQIKGGDGDEDGDENIVVVDIIIP